MGSSACAFTCQDTERRVLSGPCNKPSNTRAYLLEPRRSTLGVCDHKNIAWLRLEAQSFFSALWSTQQAQSFQKGLHGLSLFLLSLLSRTTCCRRHSVTGFCGGSGCWQRILGLTDMSRRWAEILLCPMLQWSTVLPVQQTRNDSVQPLCCSHSMHAADVPFPSRHSLVFGACSGGYCQWLEIEELQLRVSGYAETA